MTFLYKDPWQKKPAAATQETLGTVGAGLEDVVSTIVVCNKASTATSYRISISPAGIADAADQYIAYDTPIDGNDSHSLTWGITLAALTIVRVYAASGNLVFTAFRSEDSVS